MSFFSQNIVNWVIYSPLIFAALIFLLPSQEKNQIRAWTFVGMLVNFAFTLWMYFLYDPAGGHEFQLEARYHWLDALGMSYHVGVDGLAASLILLTGLLGPVLVLASWSFIQTRVKEFHLALLFIQTAMLGTLGALDIILFYIFFEAMLIPMYLLIGVWGSEERTMAAVKFFLYTLFGSLLMLVAILAIYFISQPGPARSFDYASIYNALLSAQHELASCPANGACTLSPLASALKLYGPLMFLAFALAFAIKVPMFPLHTWLPDAHVQAPVAGSIVLAGVMLKMGTFGFWRYAIPLFPTAAQHLRLVFALLAVIGVVYGALMCMAQRDIKKLIAYSSVSHLGYCMLGMFAFTPEGATGSAYQMLNHGISTGALFLLFGLLYERRHTRLMSDYGGIAKLMPFFAAAFVIITFSSVAVPGTNGFVGEFLVLLGAFKALPYPGMWGSLNLSLWLAAVGCLGIILGAVYMLWMVQRVFFGPVTQQENLQLVDLNWRERATVIPFLLLVIGMGVAPQFFLDRIEPSTRRFVARATLGPGTKMDDQLTIQVMGLPPLPSSAAPMAAQASLTGDRQPPAGGER